MGHSAACGWFVGVDVAGLQFHRADGCLVYVQSDDDVSRALAKDREYIGDRYVEGARI